MALVSIPDGDDESTITSAPAPPPDAVVKTGPDGQKLITIPDDPAPDPEAYFRPAKQDRNAFLGGLATDIGAVGSGLDWLGTKLESLGYGGVQGQKSTISNPLPTIEETRAFLEKHGLANTGALAPRDAWERLHTAAFAGAGETLPAALFPEAGIAARLGAGSKVAQAARAFLSGAAGGTAGEVARQTFGDDSLAVPAAGFAAGGLLSPGVIGNTLRSTTAAATQHGISALVGAQFARALGHEELLGLLFPSFARAIGSTVRNPSSLIEPALGAGAAELGVKSPVPGL